MRAFALLQANVLRELHRAAQPLALGALERHKGVLEVFNPGGVGGTQADDAQAGRHRLARLVDHKGGVEAGLHGIAMYCGTGADHGKRIPRKPGDVGVGRQTFTQALGHFTEQSVAVIVPEHVVHGSKLVQVQHHQALALFTPGLYALIELVHQGRAVGQGQLAVYKRIAAQLGHQIDVLGPQRNVGTENLQQFFVHVANGRGRGDVGGKPFVF